VKWPPRDLCSSGNCLCCRFCLTSDFLSHVGPGHLPAASEDFQAEIVAGRSRQAPGFAWECGGREEVVTGLVTMGHDLERWLAARRQR
jgi:hypothetical protein